MWKDLLLDTVTALALGQIVLLMAFGPFLH